MNDSIDYELDDALVMMYDWLRDLLFLDTEQYYSEFTCLPIWVSEAGQNSDCAVSANMFSEFINKYDGIPNLYKHLYLKDCQFLVGTIQNLLCAMRYAYEFIFGRLTPASMCKMGDELSDQENIIMSLSENTTEISTMIETYFTKAYSVLDIICKICYEIQNLRSSFDAYQRIVSHSILWGNRRDLAINERINTLFESCELIKNIEAIRNEVVHNGTWEINPRLFVRYDNDTVVEEFMLFPDMEQGHLTTVKGNTFFQRERK